MKKSFRIVLIMAGSLLLIIGIGPLILPVSALEGTLPPEQLTNIDSRFIKVNGIQVHYQMYGQGEPAFFLLHGFLASTFSWREVTGPLAEWGTVVVYDRPGFGLTERPLEWDGANPYSPEAQVGLLTGLMDGLGIEKAILLGNSAGGSLSVYTALKAPERVRALILVDPAIYTEGGAPRWIQPLLRTPQARRIGPLLLRNLKNRGGQFGELAWHDPCKISREIWEGYRLPLQVDHWDRALWEFVLASHSLDLVERLKEIPMPVLVITGDDDRIVPTEESIRLASEIPDAELAVIPDCGHVPQEECPEYFMEAVNNFLEKQDNTNQPGPAGRNVDPQFTNRKGNYAKSER